MKISHSVFLSLILLGWLVVSVLPQTAEAKVVPKKKVIPRCYKGVCAARVSVTPGADEKDYKDPASRCLTKQMNQLHEQAVKQIQKDIAKYGQGHEAAVKTYQEKLTILWSAMHEPYCGYGSQGMTAVKHSWDKTINNARTAFLEAVGAKQVAKK